MTFQRHPVAIIKCKLLNTQANSEIVLKLAGIVLIN